MNQQPTITLSIKESGAPPNTTYIFHISLNGHPILTNQSLSSQDSENLREISRSYSSLFEQSCRPEMEAGTEAALGAQLFALFLASSWEKIMAALPSGSTRFLTIASDASDILNLPWELLRPPGGDFLGLDPRFAIRRLPGSEKKLESFGGELRPRPLRLLFMACAPTDQATLDYEREEESLFRAVSGQDVAFGSCDLGTFQELKERVSEYRPHILHLTGHGVVRDGKGHFAFEKEDGTSDLVPADELRRFLSGSGVQCVFASGCQIGQAPREALAGVCQALVGAEVPLAVGWAASIADDLATNFARTFYKTLRDGQQSVDRALCLARQEAWAACKERGDPSWTLPVLYSATSQSLIFDPNPQRPLELPARPAMVQEALPGMKEGYAEHFVGRRREQQRLLPVLKSGDLQLLFITGLGGSGKSTLATRLTRKLETYGFMPVPLSSSKENPLSSARLLQAFGDAFREAARNYESEGDHKKAGKLEALVRDLKNPDFSVEDRLHDAVSAMNSGRFLVLLDNFESNLDEEDLRILDPEISLFYRYLMENLSGSSRAIITTRYPPSDVSALPPKSHHEDLSDFSQSSFLKILQRDPEVERRIRSGALPISLLTKLHQTFGGTPRFLLQIREALKKMDAKALKAELEQVTLFDSDSAGELQKIRDRYFLDIITERLFSYLSPESQGALCRAAVFTVPVNLEGFSAVSGVPQQRMSGLAGEWRNRAFVYHDPEKSIWTVFGILRVWLFSKLSVEDQEVAHKAAGDLIYRLLKQRNEASLGLNWIDCLLEARNHYVMGRDINKARGATNTLSTFYLYTGNYKNVININDDINKFGEYPNSCVRIGQAYLNQGNQSEAIKHFEKAKSLIQNPISHEGAAIIHGLAQIERIKGNHEIARKMFQSVIEISRQINDPRIEGHAIGELAIIDHDEGKLDDALNKLFLATEIESKISNKHRDQNPSILHNIGSIYMRKKEYDKSLYYFLEALKIEQNRSDKYGEGMTFFLLANVALHLKKPDCCLRLSVLSIAILKSIGHYYFREIEPIVSSNI